MTAKLFKQILLGNLGTKVVALCMAGALWTYAYFFSLKREADVEIPLTIIPPRGWAVITKNPASLRHVTLVYPTHAANDVKKALSLGEIRAVYRLNNEPGDSLIKSFADVQLQSDDFVSTAAADLRFSTEERISFTIAKQGTKVLKVKLNLSEPPDGYTLRHTWWWDPREVQVRGPVEALEKADSILTKRISVSPPPEDSVPIRRSVALQDYVLVEGNKYTVSSEDRIDYILYVSRKLQSKEFQKIPIRVRHLPDYKYKVKKIKPQEINVTVRGPENELDGLQRENVVLFVDVTNLGPKSTSQLVDVLYQIKNVPTPNLFEVELQEGEVGVDIQEEVSE